MLGLWAIGEAPHGVDAPGQGISPTITTERFATHSFTTRSTDTPSDTYVPGRISRGLQITRSVTQGPDGMYGGLVTASFGSGIEFANPDGGMDHLLDAYPDGRPVTIKLGFSRIDSSSREVIDAYDDFESAFMGVAGSWQIERDRAILGLRDPGLRLQGEMAKSRYRGTGGEEGDENLEGKTRPSAIGRVYNAEPVLFQPGYLIYQIHGGPVASIDEVYDAGVQLDFAGDYPDFEELQAATVPPSEYATCVARGYIKLGSLAVGTVTVDLQGDAGFPGEPWSDDDPWSDSSLWQGGTGSAVLAGHVALKLLLEYARIPYTEIDELSFTSVDTVSERPVGIYIAAGESRTIESVLADIGMSSGVLVGTNKLGKFAAFRLELGASVGFTFTDDQIIDIERQPLPYGVPWYEWSFGWRRSWTVQSGTEIAGNVDATHRAFVAQEYRTARVGKDHIRAAHWTSRPAPLIPSVLVDRTDAFLEANKRLAFYGMGRDVFRVTVKNVIFRLEIGTVVRLRIDRFGLDAGREFVVTSITEDLGEVQTAFTCFG